MKTAARKNYSDVRLLIFTASVGTGHNRAAEALAEACRRYYPDAHAEVRDTLDFVPNAFRAAYAGTYLPMVNNAPALWGYLYDESDRRTAEKISSKLRIAWEQFNTRHLLDFVKKFQPTHILCTHFLAPEVLTSADRKTKKVDVPLSVVVTDFDVHTLWLNPRIDNYFVANEEVAYLARRKGNITAPVYTTGIPIHPAFSDTLDRERQKDLLGFKKDVPTVFLLGGGAGVGKMDEIFKEIIGMNIPMNILVSAGRNTALMEKVEKMSVPPGYAVSVMGFVTNVQDYLGISDLAITKAGGLQVAECLALGVPMVIASPIPGQEERNADYVVELGAAVKAPSRPLLRFKLEHLLGDKEKLRMMSRAASEVGRPFAARDIIKHVMDNT
ncbi:MAG TPA: glycosyltransferase [Candidatus Kapabacteria bacterium]|nr:glycosyltransferase [Candidatus Kapabacteria bacterium]